MKEAEKVTFRRCVKPKNSKGDPQLIICSDGSELAMCATAHVRWECQDGSVWCQLWSAKARVAPLKKLTIPKLELQAAVLGTRLAQSVIKNSIWKFSEVYRIVDSECTLSTLKKDSFVLPEFQANRVTECLENPVKLRSGSIHALKITLLTLAQETMPLLRVYQKRVSGKREKYGCLCLSASGM